MVQREPSTGRYLRARPPPSRRSIRRTATEKTAKDSNRHRNGSNGTSSRKLKVRPNDSPKRRKRKSRAKQLPAGHVTLREICERFDIQPAEHRELVSIGLAPG